MRESPQYAEEKLSGTICALVRVKPLVLQFGVLSFPRQRGGRRGRGFVGWRVNTAAFDMLLLK